METTLQSKRLDHVVRALSHDMSANFMLLEDSFAHLKRSLAETPEDQPLQGDKPAADWSPEELCAHMAHVDACMRESKRLLDDLARLARTGSVEMEPGPVDLSAVVNQVLFEQHDLLRRRGIEVDVERPLPIVWCNEGRLKQIVTNLVRNAAYHGCDPHRPRITIGSPTPRDAAEMVSFRIHDNGPGIDPRFHREIFMPGRRLAETRAEGSGMGLAIVQDLAHHYGGDVSVDPDCQEGTAFVVSLPGVDEASQPPEVHDPTSEGARRPWQLQLDGRHAAGPGGRHRKLSPQSRELGT